MATDTDVAAELRAAILRGDYVAGQRLVEADLCERFGASRFVIRTALQTLAGQGLVEVRRNQGARVRLVTIEEAIEITEVRRGLEGLCAARAAERATTEDRAELRGIVKQMKAAARGGDPAGYNDLNAQLHASIRRIAAHETSSRLIEQLRSQVVRHQYRLALVSGRTSVSLPQHEAIVAAIVAGDPKTAEEAMCAHIDSVIASLHELSTSAPQP